MYDLYCNFNNTHSQYEIEFSIFNVNILGFELAT